MKGNVSDSGEKRKKEWHCNYALPCPLPWLAVYYQVVSEMFPKLGIILLQYKACITIVVFFFLVQQSNPKSESQCSCGHFRCAPSSKAAAIWAVA